MAQCVPDVESLEIVDPARFKAQVRAGIGPVRGKFGFDVSWQELTRPSRARMTEYGVEAAGQLVYAGSAFVTLPQPARSILDPHRGDQDPQSGCARAAQRKS